MEASKVTQTADLTDQIEKIWGGDIEQSKDPGQTINLSREGATKEEVAHLKKTLGFQWAKPKKKQAPSAAASEPNHEEDAKATREVSFATDRLKNLDPDATDHILVGQDAFTLKKQIGKGGMGLVFSADQASLGREVAVKTLEKETDLWLPENASFVREALITARLSHPNIVPVYHFGRDERGLTYIVMKKVLGTPWNELLHPAPDENGKAAPTDLSMHLEIFQKVCDAIAFAHHNKIIHRDIKPDNMMVGEYGEATVMDWGLALDLTQLENKAPEGDSPQSRTVAGSPAYMAPEMVMAQTDKLSPATDIYLLGATLYEILTGVPPHRGKTVYDALKHAAFGKLDQLVLRDGLPKDALELDRVVRKAMAKEPDQRYPDVATLQADVRAFQARQGDRNESDALAKQARSTLNRLQQKIRSIGDADDRAPFYPRCTDILALTRLSLKLWGYNPRAISVQQDCLVLYGNLAMQCRDWGLAESLMRDLKLTGSAGVVQAARLEKQVKVSREAWERRSFLLRRTARAAAIATFFTAGLSIYFYWNWRSAQAKVDRMEVEMGYQKPARNLTFRPRKTPKAVDKAGAKVSEKNTPKESKAPSSDSKPSPRPDAARSTKLALKVDAPWQIFVDMVTDDRQKVKIPGRLKGLMEGPDNQMILWDGSGRAWKWKGPGHPPPTAPLTIKGRRDSVVAAAWVDDRRVILADDRGLVRMGHSADRPWSIVFHAKRPVVGVAATLIKETVAIAVATEREIWRPSIIGGTKTKHVLPDTILGIRYQADGTLVAVTENGIWQLTADNERKSLSFDLGLIKAAIPYQGLTLAVVGKEDAKKVMVLGTTEETILGSYTFAEGEVSSLAINRDGTRILAGSTAGEIVVLGGDLMEVQATAKLEENEINALAISKDDTLGLTIDHEGRVQAWDVSSEEKQATGE